jgi:topoisomerase-4 subunit A
MPAIIRDKEYNLDQGNPNSKVHYLSANPNGEAEVVEIKLSQSSTARKKIFDFDFSEMEVKGRGARGNTVTQYPVRKVDFKEGRGSTLSGLELWFDEASGRLIKDKRGKHVGKFDGDDQIIAISRSGNYKITNFDLNNRYEPENKTLLIEKFNPKRIISAVYFDGESKQHIVKRFQIETTTPDKDFNFISDGIGSRLEFVTTSDNPELQVETVKGKGKEKEIEVVNLEDIIDVKGWKAMGNRLSQFKVTKVMPVEEPEDSGLEDGDEENEVATVETEKSSQPSKKKWEEATEGEQSSLFEKEPPKEQVLVNGKPAKAKAPKSKEAEQSSLFEQKEKIKNDDSKDSDDKGFSAGETIELDL